MNSDGGTDSLAGDGLSGDCRDHASASIAIGRRIADFDARIAAALARRRLQAISAVAESA